MKDLSTFIFALTFTTFPIGKLQNAWVTLVRTGDIERLRPWAKSEKEYREFQKFVSSFPELLHDDNTNLSGVFGRRELRRFLALQTFSAFAYLEKYGYEILDSISTVDSLRSKLLSYLSENEILNNRDETEVTSIKDVKNLGIRQRLEVIADAFDLTKVCTNYFNDLEYTQYRNLLKYIIRLRGELAHGNPEPSLKKFDNKFFIKVRKEVQNAFSVFPELDEIPPPLISHFEIIQSWFTRTLSTISVIYAVPKIMTVYPALIDTIIDFNIRNSKI